MNRRQFLLTTPAAAQYALPAQTAPRQLQIFLLIGQSNMVGRGVVEAEDREPLPRVYTQNANLEWVPAADPLHWDNANAGVGPGRPFARWLSHANPNATIGLVPAASGGTSLDQWAPGGTLYTEAVRRARAALPSGTLRGILWHQGERDSRDTPEAIPTYMSRFGFMLDSLRRDLDALGAPCVVGEIGEFLYTRAAGGYPYAYAVNERLALIPLNVFRTAFVSSAALGHIGDELHFNAASQREFGRRYALAFLSLDAEWSAPIR